MIEFSDFYADKLAQKKVLIAAHRGMCGADIPCNTMGAFQMAAQNGADILEMDLFKSTDGDVFVFHSTLEKLYLKQDINLMEKSSGEIRQLRVCNSESRPSRFGVPSFDDVLEEFKGKCLINLDRCFVTGCVREVVDRVRAHGMVDQMLLKGDPCEQNLKLVEEVAPDFMFFPVFMEQDDKTDLIESMNINYMGAELVFFKETDPIAQDAYIEKQLRAGRILWANAIEYDYTVPLAAGHCDNLSMLEDPEKGWGWLYEKGFRMIQTDWPAQCNAYMNRRFR